MWTGTHKNTHIRTNIAILYMNKKHSSEINTTLPHSVGESQDDEWWMMLFKSTAKQLFKWRCIADSCIEPSVCYSVTVFVSASLYWEVICHKSYSGIKLGNSNRYKPHRKTFSVRRCDVGLFAFIGSLLYVRNPFTLAHTINFSIQNSGIWREIRASNQINELTVTNTHCERSYTLSNRSTLVFYS